MSQNKLIIPILLIGMLLSACVSSKQSHPRREKRGIAKMMMHIMWDPVRLIRYWYSYDVTKEIVKSWRKIIPTIMLLPYTSHSTDTSGIAKYIHPTVGIRDSQHGTSSKNQIHIASLPQSYYQGSAQYSDNSKDIYQNHFQSHEGIVHGVLPNQFSYLSPESIHGKPYSYDHDTSRESYDNFGNAPSVEPVDIEHEHAQHILVQHVPHAIQIQDKRTTLNPSKLHNGDGKHESKFVKPISFPHGMHRPNSASQVVIKAIPLINPQAGNLVFPSVPKHEKPGGDRNHFQMQKNSVKAYIPNHMNYNQHENAGKERSQQIFVNAPSQFHDAIESPNQQQGNNAIEQGRQEVYIVLHPNSLTNAIKQLDTSKESSETVRFPTISLYPNNSAIGSFPLLMQAMPHIIAPQLSTEGRNNENDNQELIINNTIISNPRFSVNISELLERLNKSSAIKQSSSVTWIAQKTENPARRKDNKNFDLISDGTVIIPSSIHKSTSYLNERQNELDKSVTGNPLDSSPSTLRLNGHQIDVVRLREELKHGTPVLIPFNKHSHKPTTFTKASLMESSINFPDSKHSHTAFENDNFNLPKGSVFANGDAGEDASKLDQSAESSVERNSTQRLLLFLSKSKYS